MVRGNRCQFVTIVRYVDDVLVVSRWLCPACVEYLAKCIYSRTISFDLANDGLTKVRKFTVIRILDL